jgi:hypothetical protein
MCSPISFRIVRKAHYRSMSAHPRTDTELSSLRRVRKSGAHCRRSIHSKFGVGHLPHLRVRFQYPFRTWSELSINPTLHRAVCLRSGSWSSRALCSETLRADGVHEAGVLLASYTTTNRSCPSALGSFALSHSRRGCRNIEQNASMSIGSSRRGAYPYLKTASGRFHITVATTDYMLRKVSEVNRGHQVT